MKNIFIIFSFVLLSACGDDLSGLPDPDAKAPEREPDSFSFATATEVDADEDVSIQSQVDAGQTRHYYFSIPYYNAGNGPGDLESVSFVSSGGELELSWYDGNRIYQNSDGNTLEFTSIDETFPSYEPGGYSKHYLIYFTIKNDTFSEVKYELAFTEKQY